MRGAWAWSVLFAACASGMEEGAVEDRSVTPFEPSHAAPERIETSGTVRALLATSVGLLVGTDAGLFLVRGSDAPVELAPLRLSDDDPATCGVVRALAPRRGGGALVAAAKGLFTWDGQALARSPSSGLVTSPVAVASEGEGAAEHVAVAGDDGRVWWLGEEARRYDFEGAVRALAFVSGGLFAGLGTTVAHLDPAQDQWGMTQLAGELQSLHAGADGALWAVTSEAVLQRTMGPEGVAWSRWSGAFTGAVASDPDGYGVWVAVADGAMRVGPDLVAHVPLGFAPTSLTLDAAGSLWAGEPETDALWRIDGLGAPPPSFAAEIEPFAEARCLACHGAGTSLPLDTHARWTTNALRILVSLRSRAMPAGAPLEPSGYRVVERWVEGGMLP